MRKYLPGFHAGLFEGRVSTLKFSTSPLKKVHAFQCPHCFFSPNFTPLPLILLGLQETLRILITFTTRGSTLDFSQNLTFTVDPRAVRVILFIMAVDL